MTILIHRHYELQQGKKRDNLNELQISITPFESEEQSTSLFTSAASYQKVVRRSFQWRS